MVGSRPDSSSELHVHIAIVPPAASAPAIAARTPATKNQSFQVERLNFGGGCFKLYSLFELASLGLKPYKAYGVA